MGWREAFIKQSRSDFDIMRKLEGDRMPYAHRLHYLQMATEKLGKGWMTKANAKEHPPASHQAFVRMLQVMKGQPHVRRQLGYNNRDHFSAYINSLLDFALAVQNLAPAVAGFTRQNPEYPWRETTNSDVIAPVDFDFPNFMSAGTRKMPDLVKLVDSLLRIAE